VDHGQRRCGEGDKRPFIVLRSFTLYRLQLMLPGFFRKLTATMNLSVTIEWHGCGWLLGGGGSGLISSFGNTNFGKRLPAREADRSRSK
jgi:hypothetical protein